LRPLAVALLFVLAACSSPDPTPEPTPEPAEPTPTPGRYTDAEQAALLDESIGIVYCDTTPSPEWCGVYRELVVEDRWAYVLTTLSEGDEEFADSMCRDIATVTYDDEAQPIGVTDVLIYAADGENALADCDVVPI